MLFAYEPALQPNADFLKAKPGDKVRLEQFDEHGHALFVDDPVKFNLVIDKFVQSLATNNVSNNHCSSKCNGCTDRANPSTAVP